MSLSHSKFSETFTVSKYFNMQAFLIDVRPQHAFSVDYEGSDNWQRLNSSVYTGATEKDDDLTEDYVKDLIHQGDTVIVYYNFTNRLDTYNFDESLLFKVANHG